MTAQEFYQAFLSSMNNDWLKVDYKSGRKWTEQISNIMENIISTTGLTFEKEFYRIDYIGWKDRKEQITDEANSVEVPPCLWDLKIAVEHENDSSDWAYELVKLIHVSAPLKVIIGYSPCDERGQGGLEEQRLKYAAELMSKVKAFENTSRDEYLIILGNASPKNKCKPIYDDFGYRGYIYKEGEFCKLEQ